MKKQFHYSIIATLVLLSGCANYNAIALNDLSSQVISTAEAQEPNGIAVVAKQFDQVDCKRYLDRNVLSKGYQPLQLYIQNNSDQPYLFSLNRLSLSHASPEEVAKKVHTSTVGRAVGYGVGAVFLWPLAIPAIVDGIKSSEANDALDVDFLSKTARDQVILPYSHFNKIVFVPVHLYQPAFNVTLVNAESGKTETFKVIAN